MAQRAGALRRVRPGPTSAAPASEGEMTAMTAEEEIATPPVEGGVGPRLTSGEWLLLLVLAAVQLTHTVDFMIIMPLGPVYISEMALSPGQFGAVVAAYTLSAGLAGLLAARFLDRFGRKPALLTLYGGFIVGTFFCAGAPDYPLLLASRTVAGAFGGVSAALVLAIVGDAFHDSRRGTAMGVVMSAFSVASIAGVPLGLVLAEEFGWRAPFAVLGGFGLGVLGLAAVVLPPLRGHLGRGPLRRVSSWAVLTDSNHLRAFTLMAALVLASFILGPFLPTYLVDNIGLAQGELKYMYLSAGLVTLVTLTLFGRLSDRFGKLLMFRLLALATLGIILVMTNLPVGLALAPVLLVTTVFIVMSSGRMVPAMALITASSAPAYRGSFMSFNAAVQHLTAGAATWLGGVLLSQEEGGPLIGFPLLGVLAALATLGSILVAGRLRPAPGGYLAPDSPGPVRINEAGGAADLALPTGTIPHRAASGPLADREGITAGPE
jgi:predicted MFS family arabinose efflux permease